MMNPLIRNKITKYATTTEPHRGSLIKTLVEFDGFLHSNVVETLEEMLVKGDLVDIKGQITVPMTSSVPLVSLSEPVPAPAEQPTLGRTTFEEKPRPWRPSDPSLVVKMVKLDERAKVPVYATEGAAGADLCALRAHRLLPGGRRAIDTGIAMEIPPGWKGVIRSRSGLAFHDGVEVGAGLIDSDYRDEVRVLLHNHDKMVEVEIEVGQRIAQITFERDYRAVWSLVEKLDDPESSRVGGFGSTGKS